MLFATYLKQSFSTYIAPNVNKYFKIVHLNCIRDRKLGLTEEDSIDNTVRYIIAKKLEEKSNFQGNMSRKMLEIINHPDKKLMLTELLKKQDLINKDDISGFLKSLEELNSFYVKKSVETILPDERSIKSEKIQEATIGTVKDSPTEINEIQQSVFSNLVESRVNEENLQNKVKPLPMRTICYAIQIDLGLKNEESKWGKVFLLKDSGKPQKKNAVKKYAKDIFNIDNISNSDLRTLQEDLKRLKDKKEHNAVIDALSFISNNQGVFGNLVADKAKQHIKLLKER